jgi:hypothetical protein
MMVSAIESIVVVLGEEKRKSHNALKDDTHDECY